MPKLTMPQLGESITEGTIARWLKKPGESVKRDEPIVEIVTDKVNAEIPSPVAGVLQEIVAAEGAVVAVGQEIAILSAAPQPANPPDSIAEPADVRSSPLVRRLARENGLDIRQIQGTGLGGRVTRDDVLGFIARVTSVSADSRPAAIADDPRDEELTLSPMRRMIAERMIRSVREAPHAWLMVEVDASHLVKAREQHRESFRRDHDVDLSYVAFVLKTVADALRQHPILNSSWAGDKIVVHRSIDLGVAVALDDGLIVPVIHDAAEQSVGLLAATLGHLVSRARLGQLAVADVQGGTFTVNNTGVFGSIASQPIINYPQAAILNMEAIVKRPVVIGDAIAIRPMMNLCLSFDHRILDGATAGRFVQAVKNGIETIDPNKPIG